MKSATLIVLTLILLPGVGGAAVVAPAATAHQRDVIVLSDLHMGTAEGPGVEDFYHDRDLANMLDQRLALQRGNGRALSLVLAGDAFEFRKRLTAPAVSVPMSETASKQRLLEIAGAHPEVFAALSRFADAGNTIVLIPGNHDTDLNHPSVQEEFRKLVKTQMKNKRALNIVFSPWFYLVGNALIEHGQRYEPSNSVDYMLCHTRPDGRLRYAESDIFVEELVTPLLHEHGKLLCQKMSPKKLLGLIRGLPSALNKLFGFCRSLAARLGVPDEDITSRIRRRSDRRLLGLLDEGGFYEGFNETRKAMGMRPLSRWDTYMLLRAFGNLAAPSTLNQAKPESYMRFLWSRLRHHWRDPSTNGTLAQGEAFAMKHFPVDVFVTGHTHLAHHRQFVGADGREKHSVDAGSWVGVRRSAKESEKLPGLHFVELAVDAGKATPRLLRWGRGKAKGRPAKILRGAPHHR